MTSTLIRFLIFFSISDLTFGQDINDWPSSYEHSYENPNEKEGLEYYEGGNLHSRGPLTKVGSRDIVKVSESRRQVKETVYECSGLWTVYFDSTINIVRSTGEYLNGKKNGLWKVFDKRGRLLSEYTFSKDLIKTQVEINESGNRNIVLNRSKWTIFLLNNEMLLFFLGLLPIVGIRSFWNIVVWNNIYKTNYIPGFGKFKAGELNANVYCMIIFWWLFKDTDSDKIKMFKKIGNWVSVFSVMIFGAFVIFLSMYGE